VHFDGRAAEIAVECGDSETSLSGDRHQILIPPSFGAL